MDFSQKFPTEKVATHLKSFLGVKQNIWHGRNACDQKKIQHLLEAQSQLSVWISFVEKLAPWSEACLYSQWPSLSQGEVSAKSNKSSFWTFWTLKLTNFKTRFWTCDMCHV